MTGDGYAIQGNVLTGEEVVEAMRAAWEASAADAPLARRLLEALTAGDEAGGDRRGRQSAALLVVSDGRRVRRQRRHRGRPAGRRPRRRRSTELARLLDLNDLYLTASTEEEQVPVTPELARGADAFATARGHRDFRAWVGTENYEMRVAPDLSWIDQRVLEIVRTQREASR